MNRTCASPPPDSLGYGLRWSVLEGILSVSPSFFRLRLPTSWYRSVRRSRNARVDTARERSMTRRRRRALPCRPVPDRVGVALADGVRAALYPASIAQGIGRVIGDPLKRGPPGADGR